MQINKLISKYNYNPGSTDRIKYIVIHYVGAVGTAKGNAEYFAKEHCKSSAHYFVGYDGEVWQSVEDKNIAWHCGAKKYVHPYCRNANSIGIELCTKTKGSTSVADENWYFEDLTVASAIELTKELMIKYSIPASNVLRHYDVTGKICPAPYVFNKGKHTWDEFKKGLVETEADDTSAVIWSFFTRHGFSEVATAGIMGNLYAESGLKPENLQNGFEKILRMSDKQYTEAIDNGTYSRERFINDKAGYGLAQWTFWSLKQRLYDFMKDNGLSIGCLHGQLNFLLQEFASNSKLLKKLKKSSSILEASNAMLHDYERPADQSEKVEMKRTKYGQTFYDLYSKGLTNSKKEEPEQESFLVKVDTPFLNVRKGPGTNYPTTGGYTGIGTFTITEVKNGWGKLKSGLGWISLKYAKRV